IVYNAASLDDLRHERLVDRSIFVQDVDDGLPADLKGVLLDATAGRRDLMTHVASLGHTSIAYLSPTRPRGRRLSGYREGIRAAGLKREHVVYADESIDAAAAASHELLTARRMPTAIVCANDILAAGVYQSASQLGVRIPQDLSVAAFAGFL